MKKGQGYVVETVGHLQCVCMCLMARNPCKPQSSFDKINTSILLYKLNRFYA